VSRTNKVLLAIDCVVAGLGAVTATAGVEAVIGRSTLAWLMIIYVFLSVSTRLYATALHSAPAGFELVPTTAENGKAPGTPLG